MTSPHPPSQIIPLNAELLDIGDIARFLQVNPKTVSRWCLAGCFESIQTPNGKRRIRTNSLLACIRESDNSYPSDFSDPLLKVSEVAKKLGVRPKSISNRIGEGGFPAIRIGVGKGLYYIRQSKLDELLEQN